MLIVIMLIVIMLYVIMLNVVMLNVVMLNVVMLNVVVPKNNLTMYLFEAKNIFRQKTFNLFLKV
jgi:hypothetical protein